MTPFDFLTDDWKKIPQNLRYLILAGIFLIFNSWLLDHWGSTDVYKYLEMDIRWTGYNIGFSLIIFGFILLIGKQFLFFGRVIFLRRKYPINKLGQSFYLVWFNGKLILFDEREKKYYHVYPWETAQNLLFVNKGDFLKESFDPKNKPLIPIQNKTIDISKYKNGGSINSQ